MTAITGTNKVIKYKDGTAEKYLKKKEDCKNKCGDFRRHASAYCQKCSDKFSRNEK